MNLFCQTTTMHAPMSSYETFVSGRSINIGICLDPRIDNEHLLFKDRNEYCRFREELIDTKKTIQYRNYNLKPREARMGWWACGVISKSQKLPKPDQRTPDTTEDYPYLIIPFAENPNEGVIIFSPYCSHEPTTNMWGMGYETMGKKTMDSTDTHLAVERWRLWIQQKRFEK